MKNQEIAKIFYEISDFLEMDDVPFVPYAYQKVANILETMEEDIEDVYKKGGIESLEKISGVGKSIAKKIEEYLKTGQIKYYKKLKKEIPVNIGELTRIEGMGPKKIKVLYKKLGIKNLKSLEKVAKAHKIASLFGFGEKTEKNILEGIKFLKRSKGKFLLGDVFPLAYEVKEKLKNLKEVEEISIAGSFRRRKEIIGDADFLVISKKPKKVMDFFVALPEVAKIWSKGDTRSSIRIKQGFDMDIRVVHPKSYGSALQYFTGSKEHNIATRKIAIDKGLKLNEYGVFKGKKVIAGRTEKGVYNVLGMEFIPPELRENQGEVEAALKGKLPKLINYNDIKGDLHCHSSWNGGVNSIKELAEHAKNIGHQYLGITDHTKFLKIEHGLDEKKLVQQRKEIDKLNSKFKSKKLKFRILQGCEANILADGSIDIKDKALVKLDFVIAGIHSQFRMEKSRMTERIIKAIKNPNVDIISHPTGRLIKRRDAYQIDLDKILRVAKQTGTILEIDSYPERLDLNDQNIRRAKKAGVKMVITTDAHYKDQMRFMKFGIAQARRGWAEKKDIINTHSLSKLLKYFK